MRAIEVEDLYLRFGGIVALDHVTFAMGREILAVIGPNGAGKSALLNCICGIYRPQSGSVKLAGQEITGMRPHQVANLGIGRSFQHLELFGRLTVAENLLVARHTRMGTGVISGGIFFGSARAEETSHREAVERLLDFFELWPYRHHPAASLPFGVQKVVGVARAMAVEPSVLVLDEPASGLSRDEKEDLARFILRLQADRKIAILWVEHDIAMVSDLADRVLVLDHGDVLAQGDPDDVRTDPAVVSAYLGDSGELVPDKRSTS
jgi:branched-chain amino acid transport system ATP-binding protein